MADEPASFDERFNAAALPADTLPSTEMFGTPEAMAIAVPRAAAALSGINLLKFFGQIGKGAYEGTSTPEEQIQQSFNAALSTIGGGAKFKVPEGLLDLHQSFHDEVIAPAADRAAQRIAGIPEVAPERAPVAPPDVPGQEPVTPAPRIPPEVYNQLQEARDLGVIGPERFFQDDTPGQVAQRAIPADRFQDPNDKITMTPAGEPISEFERRFNYKMERIERPEDFKQIWKEAAAENNYFPGARQGAISPAHKEVLAEAAGVDPTTIKDSYIRDTFSRPDDVRMAAQSLDKLTRDFQEASQKYEADPSDANKLGMLRAAVLKDYALEQSTGYDAEWGHTGHALLQEMKPSRQRAQVGAELTEGLRIPKPVKGLTDAIDQFKDNATKHVTAVGKEKEAPLGLDKLIQAAADLVDEAAKPVAKGQKPSIPKSPEVNELIKTAQAVVNLMNIERPKLPGVDTVRPLRAILTEKSEQGKNALVKFNQLVTEAERNVKIGIKQKNKTPSKALSGPLADLVQRAENVTDYFGGAGLEKAVQDAMNSKGWTDEDLLNIARAVNRTDIKGTAKLMASMRGQNSNVLYWLWVQGLISGPFTHSKYALANTAFSLMERGVTTPMAAIIGKVMRRSDADRVLGGEAMAGLWGWIHGVPDAFRAIKDTPWGQRYQLDTEKILLDRLSSTGEEIPKDLLRTGQPFGKAPIDGILGRILGAPGYMAGDIHTFFKVQANEAGKSAAAYRETVLEGKKISDPDFWDRMRYHKANLPTDVLMQIRDDDYRATFMRELPPWAQSIQSFVKRTPGLRWIFPFTHIPIDLIRGTQEHSIFAFADPTFRADLLGRNGGRAQDKAVARVIGGSAIMGYMANEYMQGRTTGAYPKTQKERDEWALTGKIPYAIQIGDEWYSFERFGPAGALAGLGADIGKIIHESDVKDPESWTKMTWLAVEAAVDAAADFPGFQSIQNFFRAKEDPQQGSRFAAWQLGSLLPYSSLISQTASFLDPSMRRARTFIDGLLYRLPGARETLAPKLDNLYGEPVHNPGFASIIRNAPVNKDPVKAELDRIGYFPHAPRQEIGGVKLSPDQYLKYQATAGPLVKQSLSRLMDNPRWDNMSNEGKIQAAKQTIAYARKQAATAMQIDDPDLVRAGYERRRAQIMGQ